jgi:hypothetical protein
MEANNYENGAVELKRERWYTNETLINNYVNNYLVKYRNVPSGSAIARETGLSRETVQKHLKERRGNEYYNEQNETLRGLTGSVLAHLYKIGIEDSNIKALKVFMDHFKEDTEPQNTNINTQNNFIQINGLTISQEQIKNLSAEQLDQIEKIIKLPV